MQPPALVGSASTPHGIGSARSSAERVLLGALAGSLVIHLLGISGAADWLSDFYRYDEPDPGPPMRAVLKPPPPPTYQAPAQAPPPLRRPKPRPLQPPMFSAPPIAAPAIAIDAEPLAPMVDSAASATAEPPVAVSPAPTAPEPAPVAEAQAPEPVADTPTEPARPALRVPKRIDLVGTLFVGDQGFMVGTGGFRLRHDGNRYEISVLGQPKGLAKLMFAGEFSGVSRGAITPNGLQPSEYVEERGRPDKREVATLDWEMGVIRLRDDKVVPIEPPVLDRLSVILQFYYQPPAATELSMRVAGTRGVDTYTFRRGESERLELPFGNVEAHLWRANFDNGDPRIEIWMSPEYHYLPLRVRIHARKEFGGRFATLNIDEIRVED